MHFEWMANYRSIIRPRNAQAARDAMVPTSLSSDDSSFSGVA